MSAICTLAVVPHVGARTPLTEKATRNGAIFLGLEDRIGSIVEGLNADLMIVASDPAANVADSRSVEIVFKDGRGYDNNALLATVRGRYGRY